MTHVMPIFLERTETGIKITWSDDHSYEYSANTLRQACPCALCNEKGSQEPSVAKKPFALPILTREETRSLEIVGMRPVGNYAYHIHFSDGHNSGIYPFDLLRSLAN